MAASPVWIQRTPDSLLDREPHSAGFYIGPRRRLATCSGAVWASDSRVFTVNLLGSALHAYDFSARAGSLTPVDHPPLLGLVKPENLVVSPDRSLLAVTNSGDGSVCVYRLAMPGPRVDPEPIARIAEPGDWLVHGAAFSPCGLFLLVSTIDEPGVVRRYALRRLASSLRLEAVQALANDWAPLKPKGLAYSPDGRLLAIGYGPNASQGPSRPIGHVALHRVDEGGAIAPAPCASSSGALAIGAAEDVNFFPDGRRLLVSDQALHSLCVIGLEPGSGAPTDLRARWRAPEAPLDCPHGNAISPDGLHLAVCNYGSDTLVLFAAGDDGRPWPQGTTRRRKSMTAR